MIDFNTNHKALALVIFIIFVGLTSIVAYFPAFEMQSYKPVEGQQELTPDQRRGLEVYVSEGCVTCHTQQVRNIEMDKMWGRRPSIPSDYVYSKEILNFWEGSPSLLGSERTGPDLTSIGDRQPSESWQLLHLYDPRAVVEESVMPAFRWLFEEVDSNYVKDSDVIVQGIPEKFMKDPSKKVVATEDALALVEYLKSLKQPKLPDSIEAPEFIPLKEKKDKVASSSGSNGGTGLDGKNLFETTCATCHQSSGKGVPGAFPPLAGSGIVNNDDASTHIKIVLEGYDALPDYGPMPPFGDQLSDEEIAAIINYERSSWGNDGAKITPDDVKEMRDSL